MKEEKNMSDFTVCSDGQKMLEKARRDGVVTVWERYEGQDPHCNFCIQGLSCRNCAMGPCRISNTPEGDKHRQGVCGASADVIVARNFGRSVAAGAAAHSDHGRDLVETLHAIATGKTTDYTIRDPKKLQRLAEEIGIPATYKEINEVAGAVSKAFFDEFGITKGELGFINRAPEQRRELWKKLGVTPRGIDREIVEMMHRTHMGVDNEAISLLLQAMRIALSDGWGGSMIATELSDVIFGTPEPHASFANLAVLKKDQVNILVHGHNPIVSEMILAAVEDPELLELAKAKGAAGINLAGLCCTGNELLMRQGVPMAGNHLMTELALVTGAVEMVIVDYQCIMPGIVQVADCYHTKIITTSPKAHFNGAEHVEFNVGNAKENARKLVRMAIENYGKRDADRVEIPGVPVSQLSGFSNETLLKAMGGTLNPLIEAIKAGSVRGAVGVVGCNNPKIKHDHGHTTLARELIKRDILVLDTGCASVALAKNGLKTLEAAQLAGSGLASVCKALGIPPVLHVGSCVDNSRIIHLCGLLAKALGVDISALPVAAAAPEWYSEKALSIGLYAVGSGIYTVIGPTPAITGSETVTNMALSGLEEVVGASFAVEPDPAKAAALIDQRISAKRTALGLSA
ncbi:MAG: anaerobic carbon-monoxide dehydrogenase catalytic subunit [Deltaproteobacteria bacterium]